MYWLFVILLSLFPVVLHAENIALHYGVNHVDVNADGRMDALIRTRWENFNAHSFDRYLITITSATAHDSAPISYEVPLGETPDYRIQTREGAECLRTGYVFRLNKHHMLEVVAYRLDAGNETYCEPTHLTTTTYRLVASAGDAGLPPFYLMPVSTHRSDRVYADIGPVMRGAD